MRGSGRIGFGLGDLAVLCFVMVSSGCLGPMCINRSFRA